MENSNIVENQMENYGKEGNIMENAKILLYNIFGRMLENVVSGRCHILCGLAEMTLLLKSVLSAFDIFLGPRETK